MYPLSFLHMMCVYLFKRLGDKIVYERKKRKLSQEVLAASIDLDRTYLARIEEGKANPSIKILYKIAKRLDIKVHELLYDL